MPSALAKSPLVKTNIDSRIAHNRLRASRMAHSSSIRSTHDNVRRQHASRLPSASTPPATRSASKTNVAAQAHANCCRRLAEDGFLAQTEAAASAQHVDGLSPLLRWGPGQRMSRSPFEVCYPSCDMRGHQPRLRSVFATILAIANTPTVRSLPATTRLRADLRSWLRWDHAQGVTAVSGRGVEKRISSVNKGTPRVLWVMWHASIMSHVVAARRNTWDLGTTPGAGR